MRLAVPLLLFSMLQSCDVGTDEKKAAPKVESKPQPPRPGLHRFVITRDLDIAFDTQTGQMCRTWDWEPIAKLPPPDPVTGVRPQRKFGELTPTCLSLYQAYPSGVGVELPDRKSVV